MKQNRQTAFLAFILLLVFLLSLSPAQTQPVQAASLVAEPNLTLNGTCDGAGNSVFTIKNIGGAMTVNYTWEIYQNGSFLTSGTFLLTAAGTSSDTQQLTINGLYGTIEVAIKNGTTPAATQILRTSAYCVTPTPTKTRTPTKTLTPTLLPGLTLNGTCDGAGNSIFTIKNLGGTMPFNYTWEIYQNGSFLTSGTFLLTAAGTSSDTQQLTINGLYGTIAVAIRNGTTPAAIEILRTSAYCITPTPTKTKTRTKTLTPTITKTPTKTLTPTKTFTHTKTATVTLTSTSTRTSTVTATPTVTATASFTPTATVTPTISATPTLTSTATVTLTATVTETSTPTLTATVTSTPTLTVSATASKTASLTSTSTLTRTVTQTLTRTQTTTLTLTRTKTKTPVKTLTPTRTITKTPTRTKTPTQSLPTFTRTRTPTAVSLPIVVSSYPLNGAALPLWQKQLQVSFNKDVIHNASLAAANNPVNYLLVGSGQNRLLNTISCAGGRAGDDIQITIANVGYINHQGVGPFTASLNLAVPIRVGYYRLFICPTIKDALGNKLNNGVDTVITFSVLASSGFSPTNRLGRIFFLPDEIN